MAKHDEHSTPRTPPATRSARSSALQKNINIICCDFSMSYCRFLLDLLPDINLLETKMTVAHTRLAALFFLTLQCVTNRAKRCVSYGNVERVFYHSPYLPLRTAAFSLAGRALHCDHDLYAFHLGDFTIFANNFNHVKHASFIDVHAA